MAKMSVDLQRGLIEVDGDEKFVERVYSDIKDVILGKLADVVPTAPVHEAKPAAEKVDADKATRKQLGRLDPHVHPELRP